MTKGVLRATAIASWYVSVLVKKRAKVVFRPSSHMQSLIFF